MKTRLIGTAVAVIVVAGLMTGCASKKRSTQAAGPSPCRTTMTALEPVGTGDNEASSFSSAALVVGFASTGPNDAHIPVVWRSGSGIAIPLPPGMTSGKAADVNDSGDVVGVMHSRRPAHAFYWDGSTVTMLAPLPGGSDTLATGINATGQISGTAIDSAGNYMAVRWSSYRAAPTVLRPGTGDDSAFGQGISDAGTVGGTTDKPAGGNDVERPVLWAPDDARTLDGLTGAGRSGEVLGVNAAGVAVGASSTTRDTSDPAFATHATMWDATGAVHDMGTLAGDNYSVARGLSTSGYVAGVSQTMDYTSDTVTIGHAFVWSGTGALTPLPLTNLPWTLTWSNANKIDDKGTVAGSYTPTGGVSHAVLWTCAFGSAAG